MAAPRGFPLLKLGVLTWVSGNALKLFVRYFERITFFLKKKRHVSSCYFFIWRATLKCLSIKFHWTFFELRHSTCSTLIAAPKREKGRRLNSSMPHQSGVLHTVVYMKQNGLGWKQTNSKRLLPHRQMVPMSLRSLIHSHILVLTPVSHT